MAAGGIAGSFMGAVAGMAAVHIVIRVVDNATEKIRNILQALGGFKGIVAGLGVIMGAALAKFSLDTWASFEQILTRVRKTANLTAEETKAVGDGLRAMAQRIAMPVEELARIAEVAGQLGLESTQDILGFTEVAAKAASAWGMSSEETAQALGKIRATWDLSTQQLEEVAGFINVLENRFPAAANDIVEAFSRVGPMARAAGVSVQEVASLITAMLSVGMEPERVGTAVRNIIEIFASRKEEIAAAMGIPVEELSARLAADFGEVVKEFIERAAATKSPEIIGIVENIFGRRVAEGIMAATINLDDFKKALESVKDPAEAVKALNEEFALSQQTMTSQLTLLNNTIRETFLQIGETIAPVFITLINLIKPVIPLLIWLAMAIAAASAAWLAHHAITVILPSAMAKVLAMIGLQAGALQGLTLQEKIATIAHHLHAFALQKLSAAQVLAAGATNIFRMALNFLAAHPIIAILMVLAGVLIFLEMRFHLLSKALQALAPVADFIAGGLQKIADTIMNVLGPVLDWLKQAFFNAFAYLFNVFRIFIGILTNNQKSIADKLRDIGRLILTVMLDVWKATISLFFDGFKWLVGVVMDGAPAVADAFRQGFVWVMNVAGDIMIGLADVMIQSFSWIVENIIKGFEAFVNGIIDLANKIPGVSIPRVDFSGAADSVNKFFDGLVEQMRNAKNSIVSGVDSSLKGMIDTMRKFLEQAKPLVQQFIESGKQSIVGFIDEMKEKFGLDLGALAKEYGIELTTGEDIQKLFDAIEENVDKTEQTGDKFDNLTDSIEGLTDVVDKVNARDMSVTINLTVSFGAEIAGMSKEEFQEYATSVLNQALIKALKDAGMYQIGT